MANKLIPLSSTGIKAVGKTHNQRNSDGTTGIPIGNIEVENNEVINDNGDGSSSIFSDRLLVPNTNLTFASYAEEILKTKGKLEKRYFAEIDKVSSELEGLQSTNPLRTQNTITRNAEKHTQATLALKSELDMYDNELVSLAQLQEAVKKESGIDNTTNEQGKPQFALGKDTIASGAQFLSGMVSSIGNSIMAAKIAGRPVPQANMVKKQSIRTKYDVAQELNDVNNSERQMIDYIKNNTANSNVGNSLVAAISTRYADAKSRIFAKKFNAEAQLEGRQASMDMQRDMVNSQMQYQSDVSAYNAANYGDQLKAQSISSLMDNTYNILDSDKKLKADRLAQKIAIMGSPEGVGKDMTKLLDAENKFTGFDFLKKENRLARRTIKTNNVAPSINIKTKPFIPKVTI